jgi:negative regulator of replication initiation
MKFLVIIIICLLSRFYLIQALDETYRPDNGIFQFQTSFSGPFGGTHIPFWETSGSAMVMDSYVRLTPNQRSQRGSVWSTRPIRAVNWEILMKFSIGSETRLGADGMALWYAKERSVTGPVVGNTDIWTGIGVIIDTFDNDGQRDNPQIYAIYNDGSLKFNPQSDGKQNALGICSAQIRQISKSPEEKFVKLLVRLKDKILTVSYDNSEITSLTNSAWTECLSAKVPFPEDDKSTYHLGVTAETGGLSDFHDVKSISTWSLRKSRDDKKEELKENKEKEKEPLDSRAPTKEPAKETPKEISKDIGASASEIVSRLLELEKRDDAFSVAIDTKFKEMQQKLEAMEKEQLKILNGLFSNLDTLRSTLDVNQLIELKGDVKTTLTSLSTVKERVDKIETQVEGTNQKTVDLHDLHNTKSSQLRDIIESSSSWGFWTYFIFFQVILVGAVIMWKRSQEKVDKKFI